MERTWWHESVELMTTIFKSLIISAVIILFIAQVTIVEGHSMEPNLYTSQRLVIDKITYEFYEPQRGDIVVVELPDSEIPLIKRVIALAGESVETRNNQVFVNGVPLDEPYLADVSQWDFAPTVVPAEHVFVMGDNRPNSRDSRSFGAVDVYRIMGKARWTVWPPSEFGTLR